MTDRTVMEHPVSECKHPIDAFSAALTEVVILHAVAVAAREREEEISAKDNILWSLLTELESKGRELRRAMNDFLINADDK